MARDIDHYWAKFRSIGDRVPYGSPSDFSPKDLATLLELQAEIASLVERIDDDISRRQGDLNQLLDWASTFCDLQAQIFCDLENHSEAILAFSKSLDYSYFYEVAVRLIRAMCEADRTDEASSRVQELSEHGGSFEDMNDPECAAKLLQLFATYPELADSAPRSVLVDALKAVAKRGIESLELKPFKNG